MNVVRLVVDGDLHRLEQVDPVAEPVTDAVADLLRRVVDVLAAVDVLERLVQQCRLAGTRPAEVRRGGREVGTSHAGQRTLDLGRIVNPAAEFEKVIHGSCSNRGAK